MPTPKPIIATTRPTGMATNDPLKDSQEDNVIKALEGFVSLKKGSRKKPSVLKFPTELGSQEIPHVMQFKIFWRFERKDLTDARRVKEEEDSKIQIAKRDLSAVNDFMTGKTRVSTNATISNAADPVTHVTDLVKLKQTLEQTISSSQEKIGTIQSEIDRGGGFSPLSQLEGTQHTIARQASDIEESAVFAAQIVGGAAARTGAALVTGGATEVANTIVGFQGKPPVTKPLTDWASSKAGALMSGVADIAMNLPQYDQMVSIYLPICTSINGDDTFVYEEADMKELKGILDGMGGGIGGLVDAAAQGGSALIDVVGDAELGGKFSQAKQAFRGTVMNPRLEKMFKSKGFRSFSFAWDMYPKNQEESKMINDIIETFRYHSSPSLAEEVFGTKESSTEIMLRVPAEFTVRFLSTNPDRSVNGFVENEFIPKIARCALTNISVNRTPQSLFSTFEDNSPIGVSITLSFDEISVILRQDIEKGY